MQVYSHGDEKEKSDLKPASLAQVFCAFFYEEEASYWGK